MDTGREASLASRAIPCREKHSGFPTPGPSSWSDGGTMIAIGALLLTLVANASPGSLPGPSGEHADMARGWRQLTRAVNDFDRAAAMEAREQLFHAHGPVLQRLGNPHQLDAIHAIGEPFAPHAIDWWDGPVPDPEERILVVWWHPEQTSSRPTVLGAQALGQRYDLPVVALITDGTRLDREAADDMMRICPEVTFAAAPASILPQIDLTIVPRVSVIEQGQVLWHGNWDQLYNTPLRP